MDQTNPIQQPMATVTTPLSDAELRYYYLGFHRTLKRYRTITTIGWIVVVIGCVSFPVGWSVGRPGGLIEISLSSASILAGLGLVWQSISSLEAYIRIAFPFTHNGEQHPLVHHVVELMKEVDDGGWHEAYTAIRMLEQLRTQYDLPPLS